MALIQGVTDGSGFFFSNKQRHHDITATAKGYFIY